MPMGPTANDHRLTTDRESSSKLRTRAQVLHTRAACAFRSRRLAGVGAKDAHYAAGAEVCAAAAGLLDPPHRNRVEIRRRHSQRRRVCFLALLPPEAIAPGWR